VYIDSSKAFGRAGNRLYKGKKRNCSCTTIWWKEKKFNGEKLWARGYAVSTVGFELEEVKKYIKNQTDSDKDDDDDGHF
jgi:putative transposase